MKKLGIIILVVIIIGGLSIGGYFIFFRKKPAVRQQPTKIKIKLPTGEVVDAYHISWPKETKQVVEIRKESVILTGTIKWEKDEHSPVSSIVLETETGSKYILFNPKYENLLIFNAVNKKVKIKGITMGEKTSFKGYPGIWIEDVLEISD